MRQTKEETRDHTVLTFGKYAGKSPARIAEHDPSYIVWLYDNVRPLQCSKVLRDDCEQEVKEQRPEVASQDDVMDTYDRFSRHA